MNHNRSSERGLAVAAWILAVPMMSACGAASQVQAASPPACDCCVMNEAPSGPGSKLTIAAGRTDVQRLKLTGVVYESDGKTPAPGVTMYVCQTDESGRYTKRGDENRDSFTWWHGKQRGWLKTNEKGEYELDTIRPAAYWERVNRHARNSGLAEDPSGLFLGRRDITLLEEYDLPKPDSGRAIAAESPAFDP